MDVAHNDIDDVILELRATGAPSHLETRSPEAITDVARLAQTIAHNAPPVLGAPDTPATSRLREVEEEVAATNAIIQTYLGYDIPE